MLTEEEKDFSLDHIIMMAVSEVEGSQEEVPKIYIDNRFQNYSIKLNDLQVGDMVYAIQCKLQPFIKKENIVIKIIAILDDENPNMVDLAVNVEEKLKSSAVSGVKNFFKAA